MFLFIKYAYGIITTMKINGGKSLYERITCC